MYSGLLNAGNEFLWQSLILNGEGDCDPNLVKLLEMTGCLVLPSRNCFH